MKKESWVLDAKVLIKIPDRADGFVPLDNKWHGPTGPFTVCDRKARGIKDLSARLMYAKTEIDILYVKKIILIHPTQFFVYMPRYHHECARNTRHRRYLVNGGSLMKVDSTGLRMIGHQAIEPELLD
jgi:hypothetical protein